MSGTTSGFDPNCGRWPANVVLSHAPECKKVGTRQVRTETAVRQNLPPEGGSPGNIPIAPCKSRGPDVTYGDENGMETIEAWDCVPGCPVQSIDAQSGTIKGKVGMRNKGKYRFMGTERVHRTFDYGSDDIGGASRFFNTFAYDDEDFPVCIYTSKAARSERDKGLNERNPHPTIKPIALMRHLVRLVTPPGGLVLDPFAGSGTTLIAATLENMRSIGIEIDEDYIGIINQRLDAWQPIQGDLGLAI